MSGLFYSTPDYGPMANASLESAKIADELGRDQMAQGKTMYDDYMGELRRQFDKNFDVTSGLVKVQTDAAKESLEQARDAYAYSKTFRPMEQDMLKVAMSWKDELNGAKVERDALMDLTKSNADELYTRTSWFDKESMRDLADYSGGDSAIAKRFGADIEGQVGNAVADARAGQAQAQGSAIRQALRYGINPGSAAAGVQTAGASQIAAAANSARREGITSARENLLKSMATRQSLFGTSQAALADAMQRKEGALSTNRNQRIQDEAIMWGRGMDVSGLGRGMVGASQGAYGLAASAAGQAVQSQMAPSSQLLQGMASGNNFYAGMQSQGANTIMNGRSLLQNGLGNVLNAQTSAANAGQEMMGTMIGAGIGKWSDPALKINVTRIGTDPRGFGRYRFTYAWGGPEQVGVMADEVEKVMPAAVGRRAGFRTVNYSILGA